VTGVDSPVVSAWEVTRHGRTEVEVLLRVGTRSLVARLTRAELDRVADILDAAVAAERRNDYSRIRLGAALVEAIGRDPLRSPHVLAKPSFLPWWQVLLYLVLGVGFAVRHLAGWWQFLGWGTAAFAVTDLVQHVVWRHRRRLR
jgi:hypothetical protein